MNTTYNITQLMADLTGIMHGTTLNQITNLYGVIDRAASQLLMDCDPQETIVYVPLVNAVYSQVYSYPLPVDVKGNRIISILPQVRQGQPGNQFAQSYNQNFATSTSNCGFWRAGSQFSLLFNAGLKTININWDNANTGVLLNEAGSPTINGTWSTAGNATNIGTNNINFVSGGSSISFDLITGANPSFGNLINTTNQPVNLSDFENESVLFIYTYLPNASDFISVTLQWGSSASDYWSSTATLTQQNTAFQNGWNLLAFPWVSATPTGTPNSSSITYLNVIWEYNGVQQTGVLLDNIVSRLGSILNIGYYSKYLFRNPITNAFQEKVLTNSDYINLDTESYTMFTYLVAAFAAQQQSGAESVFDTQYFLNLYNAKLNRYRTMYKSQVIKPKTVYYPAPNYSNLRRFYRGRY